VFACSLKAARAAAGAGDDAAAAIPDEANERFLRRHESMVPTVLCNGVAPALPQRRKHSLRRQRFRPGRSPPGDQAQGWRFGRLQLRPIAPERAGWDIVKRRQQRSGDKHASQCVWVHCPVSAARMRAQGRGSSSMHRGLAQAQRVASPPTPTQRRCTIGLKIRMEGVGCSEIRVCDRQLDSCSPASPFGCILIASAGFTILNRVASPQWWMTAHAQPEPLGAKDCRLSRLAPRIAACFVGAIQPT